MKKIIIFIPRSEFLESDRVMPSLGPLYLKSFIESHGHHVEINDEPETFPIEKIENYDIIGYSCTTPQSKSAINHCKMIKKIFPDKKTVIGGSHAKYYHEELLKNSPFDFIILGDGEYSLLKIMQNNTNRLVKDNMSVDVMNNCPLPHRDKFLNQYHYYIKERRATTAITGKFCPMGCKFCESRYSGLVLYTPEHIEAEIIDIKDKGFNAIMYYDDIFAINLKRVKELCEVIKRHDIYFRCFAHAKTFTNEMAKILVDAGCKIVCWGAESGHQKILDIIGKGTTVEMNYEMTNKILNHGMKAVAFCMIGLPGENKETIADTEKFIATFANNPDFTFDYTIFYPFQKTYIRENIKKYDLKIHLNDSIGYYKGKNGISECCVSTSSLTREDILKAKNRICKKYNIRFTGLKNEYYDKTSEIFQEYEVFRERFL